MALYVIADLHLSFGADKPMEIFSGWDNYVERLSENWHKKIKETDMVVLPGDISWGMDLSGAEKDFAFIDALPGEKILLKGNHDYWFTTKKKTEAFWAEKGFSTLRMLFNNAYFYRDVAICGSRGWCNEPGQPADLKVLNREAGRLAFSLEAAKGQTPKGHTPIVFLHYPPLYPSNMDNPFTRLLAAYSVGECYYGHVHGPQISRAVTGLVNGINYRLISGDAVDFVPVRVL